MMTAGKKKLENKNTDTLGSTRSMRADAEEQLARSHKSSSNLKEQTPGQLIHELQVHQIELENQAEELRKSKNALEELRDKYIDLYDFAPIGYFTLNEQALISDVNLAGATLIGVGRSKLVNTRFRKFIAKNDNEKWIEYFMQISNQDNKQTCTLTLKRGDGSTFPARLESIRITNSSNGKPTVRVAISNIADIHQAEEALKDSEERYRTLVENHTDIIMRFDREHRHLFVNSAVSDILPLTPADFIGKTHREMDFPEHLCDFWEKCIEEVFIAKKPYLTEFSFEGLHGKTFLDWKLIPEFAENGSVATVLAIARDMTHRKTAEVALLKNTEELHANLDQMIRQEQELQESREKYRSLFTDSRDGIVMVDEQGRFVDANEVYCAMLGYSVEELRTISFPRITPEKWQAWEGEEIWNRRLMKDGYTGIYEKEYVRKDGIIFPVELQAFTVFDTNHNVKYVWGTVRDITKRKQQELALLKNAEELHAANEQLAAAEEELKGQFDALAESEQLIRESEEHFRTIIHSLQFGIVIIDAQTHTILEANPKALDMIGANIGLVAGSVCHRFICPAELGKCPVTDLLQTVDSSERVLLNLRGEKIPILKSVIKTMHGGREVLIESFINISDRKLAESTLQRVNQKLNALSQLTRQDLTTQIFVLNSYLEMAKNQATGQNGIIKNIESGERAVRSIKEITEFTKDYYNMGEKPPKYQNVKLLFLFGLSHISIGEIRHSLETENLEIFADPLLEKAFQGLLENSVTHGGHVSLIRVSHTITPDRVTIVFEDDGVGIPKEKKERIFLRGEGARASVRGLIFVREILDITGITIRETGEPGKGARFEMTVPKGAWRNNPDTDHRHGEKI